MAAYVKIDLSGLESVRAAVERAAERTMEALRDEVVQSQKMPFDTGDMQNNATFVTAPMNVDGSVFVLLTTDAPQARRLYYHPEYDFQQGKNANAQGEWLKDWISGDKQDFVQNTFERLLGEELKG
jgi:hypothetical protein